MKLFPAGALVITVALVAPLTGCSDSKKTWIEAEQQFEQAKVNNETFVHQLGDWTVAMYPASVNHSITYVFEATNNGGTAENVVAEVGTETIKEQLMSSGSGFAFEFNPSSDDTTNQWTLTLSWDEGHNHYKKQFTFAKSSTS